MNQGKFLFPQTAAHELEEKGPTLEFYATLEIYKSLLSNPQLLIEHRKSSVGYDTENPYCTRLIDEAIQLGKAFVRKFNESNK